MGTKKDYPETSLTLLRRVRDDEEIARTEFFEYYKEIIFDKIKSICLNKTESIWSEMCRTHKLFGRCDVDITTNHRTELNRWLKKKAQSPQDVLVWIDLKMRHMIERNSPNKGLSNIEAAYYEKSLSLQMGKARTFRNWLFVWIQDAIVEMLYDELILRGKTCPIDGNDDPDDSRTYAQKHENEIREGKEKLANRPISENEKRKSANQKLTPEEIAYILNKDFQHNRDNDPAYYDILFAKVAESSMRYQQKIISESEYCDEMHSILRDYNIKKEGKGLVEIWETLSEIQKDDIRRKLSISRHFIKALARHPRFNTIIRTYGLFARDVLIELEMTNKELAIRYGMLEETVRLQRKALAEEILPHVRLELKHEIDAEFLFSNLKEAQLFSHFFCKLIKGDEIWSTIPIRGNSKSVS